MSFYTISIITVNYNDVAGLERTIKSVQEQTATSYEHIIIDGGSTDGSKQLIEQHKDSFSYWVSEPDLGIYDAMNKGVIKAQGDFINFLNSGDLFYNSYSLERIVLKLGGKAVYFTDVYLDVGNKLNRKTHPRKIRLSYLFKNTICHQSIFYNTKYFKETLFFDISYRLVADWVHLTESIILKNYTYQKINGYEIIYDMTGVSASSNNMSIIEKERATFLKSELSSIIEDYDEYFKAITLYRKDKQMFDGALIYLTRNKYTKWILHILLKILKAKNLKRNV